MRKQIITPLAIIVTVLVLGLAGCSGSSDSSSKDTSASTKSSPDLPDFYAVPNLLPIGGPGTIIKSEPVEVAGLRGSLSRVMYVSTTVKGDKIAVTGMIAVPNGDAPASGWPVVSWAHGTTGLADSCAPSLKPEEFTELANGLLNSGYLVVATDYEGLGTPGLHPYISGHSEAYGTLDIVKAAQVFPGANASKRYAVWGHSQGGHAAMFAGNDAEAYAPDLELVGVVAGAPPSQLLLINAALQASPFKHYIAMAAGGLNASYGDTEAPLNQVLTKEGLDFVSNLSTKCSTDLGKIAANLDFSKLQLADPATVPAWSELLRSNDPANFVQPFESPLLIIHGGNDEQIPVVSSAVLFEQLCKIGQVEQRWVFEGQSHAGVIVPSAPSMLQWIGDRFANKPMPDPISPPGAVVQSCGKS